MSLYIQDVRQSASTGIYTITLGKRAPAGGPEKMKEELQKVAQIFSDDSKVYNIKRSGTFIKNKSGDKKDIKAKEMRTIIGPVISNLPEPIRNEHVPSELLDKVMSMGGAEEEKESEPPTEATPEEQATAMEEAEKQRQLSIRRAKGPPAPPLPRPPEAEAKGDEASIPSTISIPPTEPSDDGESVGAAGPPPKRRPAPESVESKRSGEPAGTEEGRKLESRTTEAESSGAPPGGSAGLMSEEDAKKQLSQDEQPSLDPSTEVKLIGPDSAKELKEADVIYKEAFGMVFSDRSGVRELERFKQTEEAKQGENKQPDALYQESEDIRTTYEDQLKIPRLVYTKEQDKKDLVRQWNELQVLAKGTNQNLKGKPNQDVLGQFNSVGVVIDVSNLGMNLQDFLNYVNQRNLTNKTDKQKGNNKLSGFMKGVNLEDVEPDEKKEPEKVEPIPTEEATKDPAQKVGVFGNIEYISNEKIKGVSNIQGLKKPVKKEKSKRVVIML